MSVKNILNGENKLEKVLNGYQRDRFILVCAKYNGIAGSTEVGLSKCLSGMRGNFHVPFLEGGVGSNAGLLLAYKPTMYFFGWYFY